MPYQNISAVLTAADQTAILAKLNEITALLPFLVNLTAEERSTLPKMGDNTEPFVNKALTYAENNPTLVPPYVNVPELRKDFNLASQLTLIRQQAMQLAEALDDTEMALGSESYVTALAFYNSVKQAAKMNVPGAEAIYDDLRTRFPGGGSTPTPPAPNP
jgi:hypothetical protein